MGDVIICHYFSGILVWCPFWRRRALGEEPGGVCVLCDEQDGTSRIVQADAEADICRWGTCYAAKDDDDAATAGSAI